MALHLLCLFLFFGLVHSQPDSTALVVGRPFKLNIASIFVRQRDLTVYYEIAKPAIDLAVEECNKKYKNFIQVSVIVRNDSELCSATYAPSLAGEEYYLKNAMAFIGPACLYSLDIVGRLAAFWNVPVFTAGGSSVEFNDKTLFSTLTRLSYSLDRISDFLLQILREFEWKHLAFIVDDSDLTMMSVDKTFKENIKEERSIRDYDIQYTSQYFTYSLNASINYRKMLMEASQEARLIILLVKGQTLREILLAAYDLGMHTKGDYTFVGIELIRAKKADAIEWYKFSDRRNKEAKIIFESLIIFTVKIPVSNAYKNFVYEVSKRARNEFKSEFTVEDVNQNIAGFYDALLIYCLVLNETLGDGDNPFDSKQITRRIWGRTFSNIDAISGDILVNANGDRETDYTLDDLDPETGQFRSVYNYYGSKRKIEKVAGVAMHWPNKENKPAKDMPECGFKNDKPECLRKSDSTLLVVILGIVLVLTLGLGFAGYRVYIKLRYENQLNDYWWKVHWEDIQFADRANIRNKSVSSIGKSETSFKTQTHSFTGKTSVLSSMATTLANVDSAILCGHYKGVKVAVKPINVPKLNITRENLIEFKQMRDVIHNNLVNFVGLVVEDTNVAIVSELCVRGSLKDMLENEKITIDWMFKCSMINDIIEGMIYLHNSPIEYHGHLKSTNLVVDSRFNVAICDYGLRSVYSQVKTNEDEFNPRCLFWTAPEHLRERFPTKTGSQKGDVYSFAIILQEIICRTGPWENLPTSHKYLLNQPDELLDRIKAGTVPPFRPEIQAEDVEAPEILPILSLSWCENPMIRPSFPELKGKLRKITRGITSSKLLDNLMKRIETYSSNLEKIVTEKTENIVVEKARAEELLNNILPQFIVEQLKSGIPIQAQSFPSVTLMFTNIEGFMELCKESTPQQIVSMLNDIYDLMDTCLANHDVYKLESINDAYLVASGVPVKNGSEHVREIAYCALDAKEAFETFRARHRPAHKFKIRIGFHSGSVVAGVIGLKMPKYCVFGDTINTASRMQTNSEPGKIHISSKSKDLLDLFGDFVILPRGEVQIKGKGSMKTFWLDSASKKKDKKKRTSKQASSETATLASMEIQANQEKQQSMEKNAAKAESNPTVQKEANNPSSDKPNPARQNSEPKNEAKKPAPDKAKN